MFTSESSEWRSWFVSGLMYTRLRVRSRPKSMDIHDTENHQRPCRMIIRHERQCFQTTIFMQDGATPHIGHQVKALLSACFGHNRDYPDIFRMWDLLAYPT
ncbi:hypothetical protein TNCV_2625461 [Trichonephila clavipes]|nr:hypothetical protein TNCV_2625461 [Trichonephila clavipes]